jgi:hypothetical protein
VYLKVICAWCGKFIGIKPAGISGIPRLPVTHGICCKCKEKLLAQADESLQRYHENQNILERR